MILWLLGIAASLAAVPGGMWLGAWFSEFMRPIEEPLSIDEAFRHIRNGLIAGAIIGAATILILTIRIGPHTW